MSTNVDYEKRMLDYLVFGGDMPNLAEGVQEVKMPDKVAYCTLHNTVLASDGFTCPQCYRNAELQDAGI